jgi:hypothetical protein
MKHFDDIMAELRATYLAETRLRALAMTQTVDHLERDPGATQVLTELVVHFHGLAGTGTSYGFAELSLLGRMGEFDSGVRQRLGGSCSREDIFTWRTLISQIQATACGGSFGAGGSTEISP